jgi:hypothetical protein
VTKWDWAYIIMSWLVSCAWGFAAGTFHAKLRYLRTRLRFFLEVFDRGCSIGVDKADESCEHCTRAFIEAVRREVA